MLKIVGERIYLRDYTQEDFDFYHSWISDPVLMAHIDWRTDTLQESKEVFEKLIVDQLNPNRNFYLAICLVENNRVIGNAGLTKNYLKKGHNCGEIGWFILKNYWGNGYAVEAAKLFIEYGIKNHKLEKIYAECAKENIQSENVMKKLNMKKIREYEEYFKRKNKNRLKIEYLLQVR